MKTCMGLEYKGKSPTVAVRMKNWWNMERTFFETARSGFKQWKARMIWIVDWTWFNYYKSWKCRIFRNKSWDNTGLSLGVIHSGQSRIAFLSSCDTSEIVAKKEVNSPATTAHKLHQHDKTINLQAASQDPQFQQAQRQVQTLTTIPAMEFAAFFFFHRSLGQVQRQFPCVSQVLCCASVSGFFEVEMFLFGVFFVWFIAFAMFLFDVYFHLLKHSQFGTGRAHWQPLLGQHTHARRLELSVRDSDCPRTLQSTGQGKGFGLFGALCPILVSKG